MRNRTQPRGSLADSDSLLSPGPFFRDGEGPGPGCPAPLYFAARSHQLRCRRRRSASASSGHGGACEREARLAPSARRGTKRSSAPGPAPSPSPGPSPGPLHRVHPPVPGPFRTGSCSGPALAVGPGRHAPPRHPPRIRVLAAARRARSHLRSVDSDGPGGDSPEAAGGARGPTARRTRSTGCGSGSRDSSDSDGRPSGCILRLVRRLRRAAVRP
jgi:hypothetical protein